MGFLSLLPSPIKTAYNIIQNSDKIIPLVQNLEETVEDVNIVADDYVDSKEALVNGYDYFKNTVAASVLNDITQSEFMNNDDKFGYYDAMKIFNNDDINVTDKLVEISQSVIHSFAESTNEFSDLFDTIIHSNNYSVEKTNNIITDTTNKLSNSAESFESFIENIADDLECFDTIISPSSKKIDTDTCHAFSSNNPIGLGKFNQGLIM